MHYYISHCQSDIFKLLLNHLSKEFQQWNIKQKENKIIVFPSLTKFFILDAIFPSCYFEIKFYHEKKCLHKKHVHFSDILSQMYKYYFQFFVLCHVGKYSFQEKTLFTLTFFQLSTNDIFYCRKCLRII
jgi:hypothetical protein